MLIIARITVPVPRTIKYAFQAHISRDRFTLFQHHTLISDIWTDKNNSKQSVENRWPSKMGNVSIEMGVGTNNQTK